MVKESEVAQSCPTLCDSMGCSLPGSSVHGIFQARVLEWVAISFSRGSSQTMDRTWVSRSAGRRFTIWATREAWWSQLKTFLYYMHIYMCVCVCVCVYTYIWYMQCKSLSCVWQCDPMDCSPPGSSFHGISPGKNTGVDYHSLLQRIFWPRDQTSVSCIAGRFFSLSATEKISMVYTVIQQFSSVIMQLIEILC